VTPLITTANQMLVNFRRMDNDQRFSRKFQKTASVKDARIDVASFVNVPSFDHITLLFNGKPLNDGFLLSRLRIGQSEINVHVKDLRDVVLQSAKALII
jgi:hypothetical protein